MVSSFVNRFPLLGSAFNSSVDYERSFWTPPLTPSQAYRLEEEQLLRSFDLPALVSLSDHDTIGGCQALHSSDEFSTCPISTEWSIPFGPTFFHLGIHNLPPLRASFLMRSMQAYTASPSPELLRDILQMLHAHRYVLTVVNHPLWDEKGIGREAHERALATLCAWCRPFLHALEANGLRSMAENQRVFAYAAELGLPVVGGGDRHGCEANSIVNLSRHASLDGIISEIRQERRSHIVFMPQYRQPLNRRTARTVFDILRDYPSGPPERRSWNGRVFLRTAEGGSIPFARLLQSALARTTFGALNLALQAAQAVVCKPAGNWILADTCSAQAMRAEALPAA